VETPVLYTNRLVLRPFVYEDAYDVFSYCSSPTVTKYLFWLPHRKVEDTQRILATWIKKKRNYSWAITKENRVIGEINCIKNLEGDGLEVGYILKDSFWGTGIMKEALSRVIEFLKSEGFFYLLAEVDVTNLASINLLNSLGFVQNDGLIQRTIAKTKKEVLICSFRLSLLL